MCRGTLTLRSRPKHVSRRLLVNTRGHLTAALEGQSAHRQEAHDSTWLHAAGVDRSKLARGTQRTGDAQSRRTSSLAILAVNPNRQLLSRSNAEDGWSIKCVSEGISKTHNSAQVGPLWLLWGKLPFSGEYSSSGGVKPTDVNCSSHSMAL